MADVGETLPILVSIEDEDGMPEPSGDKGLFGRRDGDGDGPSIRHIPVTVLRENLRQITAGLRDLFDDIAAQPGGLPLREAQVTFEVTASGGIALVGTSAQVAGRGAITLTFGA